MRRRILSFCPSLSNTLWLAFLAITAINFIYWSSQPIYIDENAYVVFLSRAFLDGWKRIGLYPACVSSDMLDIPYSFYPTAFIYSGYTFIKDTQWYRWIGEGLFASTVFLACVSTTKIILKGKAQRFTGLMPLAFSALFIGVLPLASVMVRPEGIILFVLAFTCWTVVGQRKNISYATLSVLLLLYSMAVYAHPKALYFFPAVALAILLPFDRFRYANAAALLGVLLITMQGESLQTQQFLKCPEIPAFQEALNRKSINPLNIFKEPIQFTESLAGAVTEKNWEGVVTNATFQGVHEGGGYRKVLRKYLPLWIQTQTYVQVTNSLITFSAIITLMLAIVMLMRNMRFILTLRNASKNINRSSVLGSDNAKGVVVVTAFYCAIFAMMLLDNEQYFYHILPRWVDHLECFFSCFHGNGGGGILLSLATSFTYHCLPYNSFDGCIGVYITISIQYI